MRKYDLVVIGTGPAASTVATKVARLDKSVAVIESNGFGGTCALRGCNPKKVYTNAGDLLDRLRRTNGKLATFDDARIDWASLWAFKQEFTQPILDKTEGSLRRKGIDTYFGTARFESDNKIDVDGKILEADRIFVGTGASPATLDIEGEEFVTLSDEFFEQKTIPPHVTFIGGGYISMEFAHVVVRYGSKVVIVNHHARPLQQFDPTLVDQLVKWSESIGIQFINNARVVGIEKTGSDSLSVQWTDSTGSQAIETDLVIHGAGRRPNLERLQLDRGNVRFGKNGIEVDNYMRSISNPKVFAAGDCADSPMPRLTPVANEQARIIVKNLFVDTLVERPDYGIVPKVVFTSPCLAAVGMLEEAAIDSGLDIDVRYEETSDWSSVRKTGQGCAAYKVIVDKSNGQILGAHLLGPAAEETINIFALAMKFDLTAKNIKSTLFAFPTFASDVRKML
ncbi:MAG: NAD(P)/FAD-dependent oxidoreductase [Pirellulaceae bacterium]|nr:NAD(P)/FAD-dependent oxidoreductase [Pirellulaceae bacterium]